MSSKLSLPKAHMSDMSPRAVLQFHHSTINSGTNLIAACAITMLIQSAMKAVLDIE